MQGLLARFIVDRIHVSFSGLSTDRFSADLQRSAFFDRSHRTVTGHFAVRIHIEIRALGHRYFSYDIIRERSVIIESPKEVVNILIGIRKSSDSSFNRIRGDSSALFRQVHGKIDIVVALHEVFV